MFESSVGLFIVLTGLNRAVWVNLALLRWRCTDIYRAVGVMELLSQCHMSACSEKA